MLYNDYEHFINKIVWFIPSKKHRDNFRKILYDMVNSMYRLEYIANQINLKNYDKGNVIICSSGGLADQFWHYILGESIKRNYDFNVKYDNTWFRTVHKDYYKKEDRHFELLKLCPDISYDIASEEELFFYKANFNNFNNMLKGYITNEDLNYILQTKKNVYIECYPKKDINADDIVKNIDLDKYHFKSLKGENLLLYNELKNNFSISVHARLGDVNVMDTFRSIFNSDYSEYADYFIKSINYIYNKFKDNNPKFFFFSNDINWVNNNIISKLGKNILYKVSEEKNPPHLDVYLISIAKHQIISLGGFASLAGLFNKNTNKIIIKPSDFQSFKNN
ncbi:alpha-1,2-fucosyltransferase [uncultured Brachyspira sp.]|uniref:alpha-1,2-fucosyltransferase n=3 Tax=uncultured Brachyspira sp. TaxID=221953 RepID=UPI0025DD496E|nr:alpha-1,2-fucosyltransferase [uncultured Brachyspira sp.]